MKNSLLIVFTLIVFGNLFSQCDTSRYRSPLFGGVYTHSNVKYGEAPVWNVPYNDTDLYMDIFEPLSDPQAKRPLMIWVHPGGFLLGDKTADDMVALCDSFARRGYVTASVGYRLGFNPLSSGSSERAVYRGLQDLHAAIRYLYEFADIYGIDTNYTLVGGSSAGSVAALHLAYLDQDEAPTSVYGDFLTPDLGLIESSGNNYVHEVKLAGLVNLWGALGDSSFIDIDETVPSLHIHGVDDATVPFGVGVPFGLGTLPPTHGSRAIHNQLDVWGTPHQFEPFPGLGHEFHGADNGTFNNPPNAYWDTIFNLVDQHYLSIVLPESVSIQGDSVGCKQSQSIYSVASAADETPCWNVIDGQVLSGLDTDTIVVLWDNVTSGVVSCQLVNEIAAVSSLSTFNIDLFDLPIVPNVNFYMSGGQAMFSTDDNSIVEWDFGDGTTDMGSAVSHEYTQSGIYTITYTSENQFGCAASMDTSFMIDLFASDFSLSQDFSTAIEVYPNPATDFVTITNTSGELVQLSILNLSGQTVLEHVLENTETRIDLTDLSSGIYVVYIQNSKGTVFERLIVQ
ncbi:MAG: T9SS type A sorting domain-containing protein [Crocinitomicaceae bacterium]